MACPIAYPPLGGAFHRFPFLGLPSDVAVVWPRSTIPSTGREGSLDPRDAGAAEAMSFLRPPPGSVSSVPIHPRCTSSSSYDDARGTWRVARARDARALRSVRVVPLWSLSNPWGRKERLSGSIGKARPNRKGTNPVQAMETCLDGQRTIRGNCSKERSIERDTNEHDRWRNFASERPPLVGWKRRSAPLPSDDDPPRVPSPRVPFSPSIL